MSPAYPPRYWCILKQTRRTMLRVLTVLGAAFAALGWLVLQPWAKEDLLFPAAIAGALFLFALISSVAGWLETRHAQIVPYFKETVEGPFTLCNGASLARNCLRLDALAEAKGCAPLSSFGFADDPAGEELTWHPPALGLMTVSQLLAEVREWPEAVDAPEAVTEDLELLRARLDNAVQNKVAFSLLLRHGNTISGHEVDLRQGKF
jgi:hypothetical protein